MGDYRFYLDRVLTKKKKQKVGFLLNEFPNASAGFSVRQLLSNYTGSCIRVVRVIDSVEKDIGFSDGLINVNDIESFANGTEVRVIRWYDQIDDNNFLEPNSIPNAPSITNLDGIVYKENNIPAIFYNGIGGSSQGFNLRSGSPRRVTSNDFTTSIVAKINPISADQYILIQGIAQRLNSNILFAESNDNNYFSFGYHIDATVTIPTTIENNGNQKNIITQGFNNSVMFHVNNHSELIIQNLPENISINTSDRLSVGSAGNIRSVMNGMMQEVVVFDYDIAGNIQKYKDNTNSYFNIY